MRWSRLLLLMAVASYRPVAVRAEMPQDSPRGVYRSNDNGATWSPVRDGIPVGTRIDALAVTRTALFAGTDGRGIYRSSDSGASWVEANEGIPAGSSVTAIVTQGDLVLAGTKRAGVFTSRDQGQTWASAHSGLTDRKILSL